MGKRGLGLEKISHVFRSEFFSSFQDGGEQKLFVKIAMQSVFFKTLLRQCQPTTWSHEMRHKPCHVHAGMTYACLHEHDRCVFKTKRGDFFFLLSFY